MLTYTRAEIIESRKAEIDEQIERVRELRNAADNPTLYNNLDSLIDKLIDEKDNITGNEIWFDEVTDPTPKVLSVMPDIVTRDNKSEQTYQEFLTLAEKYAPKPMTARNAPETCEHRRAYPRTDGMYCPDCWTTRPVANDFEKRISAPHRDNGYVNWRMR
jgi:hypothetical protein